MSDNAERPCFSDALGDFLREMPELRGLAVLFAVAFAASGLALILDAPFSWPPIIVASGIGLAVLMASLLLGALACYREDLKDFFDQT